MSEITVYEYLYGAGLRVVRGKHAISADSGVPTSIRHYPNIKQAYAWERGSVRNLILKMMWNVPLKDWK